MDIQKIFFDLAKSKLSPNLRLADVVGSVLNVGSDSAYRRIRGEKELSLSELAKLCQYFDISLDAMLNYHSDNVLFKYTPLNLSNFDNLYTYNDYLATAFESIAAAKESDIFLTALDVPIFHLTPFKELAIFKLYTWFQSNVQTTFEQFLAGLDTKRMTNYCDRITAAYQQIPSTEIWTNNTLNPILHLLEYFVAMDCFENRNETISVICQQLLALIKNVEQNAERGWKEYNGKQVPYRMYISPLNIVNDFMIAKCDGLKTGIVKLHTINGLFTNNEFFCSEIEKCLQDMASKSLSLTGTAARERFKFFKHLEDRVYGVLKTV